MKYLLIIFGWFCDPHPPIITELPIFLYHFFFHFKAQFRRLYRRKVKPGALDVVIVQDIKDVVLFSAEVKDLTTEFIRFFHLPTVDAFLRAGIVYFHYYFQVSFLMSWMHYLSNSFQLNSKFKKDFNPGYLLLDVGMNSHKLKIFFNLMCLIFISSVFPIHIRLWSPKYIALPTHS